MKDTPIEIEEIFREKIMGLSGETRMVMGSAMFDAAKTMALSSFAPETDLKSLKKMLLIRFYGDDPNFQEFLKLLDY